MILRWKNACHKSIETFWFSTGFLGSGSVVLCVLTIRIPHLSRNIEKYNKDWKLNIRTTQCFSRSKQLKFFKYSFNMRFFFNLSMISVTYCWGGSITIKIILIKSNIDCYFAKLENNCPIRWTSLAPGKELTNNVTKRVKKSLIVRWPMENVL